MKSSLIPCLALVLCGVSLGRGAGSTNVNHTLPSGGQVYQNAQYGFQLVVPEGWTATETNFEVSHYHDVFLTVNSRRPDLILHELITRQGGVEFGPKTILQQMQAGEVYVSVGHFEGPIALTMGPETVDEDLQSVVSANPVSPSAEVGLAQTTLGFLKRGHRWMVSVYLREPISEEIRRKVMTMLKSFRFFDAPVGSVGWAESLGWKQLPENIRGFGKWPVAREAGWPNGYGQHSVLVETNGPDYSVRFTVNGLGSWEYSVSAAGNVQPKQTAFKAVGIPASQLPSDLPGKSEGKVDAYWVAPYVRAITAAGKTTVTWFASDGSVKRQSAVDNIQPGHASFVGDGWTALGINEDWRITPHPATSAPPVLAYAASTPDSRVFVEQFSPKPGLLSLDIYIHGKRVNTIGPFLPGPVSSEFVLNDDGSTGLLVWKDESKTTERIVVLGTDGRVRFQADCDRDVWSPIVAPEGAGVLLRHNSGGTNQNTFMLYTEQGRQRSLNISPNPACVGWVPGTRKSLFWTSIGYSRRYELIDWATGQRLWRIPCPGGGEAVAIGFTPKLIIFAVGDLYPATAARRADEPVLEIGKEWVRTFYAINVEDGILVGRWPGQFPHMYLGLDRDHFLRLGDKLFYVDSEEYSELDLEDIAAKKHGWH